MTTEQNVSDEVMLQQMIDDAEEATRPRGAEEGGQVIDTPSGTEFHMIEASITDALHMVVYDTLTHEPRVINKNLGPGTLQKRRDDGELAYSIRQPIGEPSVKSGSMRCLLHADEPDRDRFTVMGLPICKKSNLHSVYEVRRHMQNTHRTEWATLEEERGDRERSEDREIQMALLNRVAAIPVAPEALGQDTEEPVVKAKGPRHYEQSCPDCVQVFSATRMRVAKKKLASHLEKVHKGD